MAFGVRILLMQMVGSHYDVLPLMHPIGLPQSMFIDFNNKLKQGNTALYLSSPRKQYFQLVSTSFEKWLETLVHRLENGFLQRDEEGRILLYFLNLDNIYADYIKSQLTSSVIQKGEVKQDPHDQAHKYRHTSCTVSSGFTTNVQCRFEILKSTILPINAITIRNMD